MDAHYSVDPTSRGEEGYEAEYAEGLGGAHGAAPYLSVFEWAERVSVPLCPAVGAVLCSCWCRRRSSKPPQRPRCPLRELPAALAFDSMELQTHCNGMESRRNPVAPW
jgi:hypothetical protein